MKHERTGDKISRIDKYIFVDKDELLWIKFEIK